MAFETVLKIGIDARGAQLGAQQAKTAIASIGRGATTAFRGIGSAFDRLRRQLFSLKGLILGLGIGLLARSFLNVARETENVKIKLQFLTNTVKEANEAFDSLLTFAGKVPFTFQEIQKAAPILLTVVDGVDELNTVLKITADIASVTGLTFEQTAQQIQRSFSAGIASADLFRERAVGAMLGFEQGVSISAANTKKQILDLWLDSTTALKGASAVMASSFDGMTSMLSDSWFSFRIALMGSGVFDFIEGALFNLVGDVTSSQDKIKKFGEDVGRAILEGFTALGRNIAGILDFLIPAFTAVQRAM